LAESDLGISHVGEGGKKKKKKKEEEEEKKKKEKKEKKKETKKKKKEEKKKKNRRRRRTEEEGGEEEEEEEGGGEGEGEECNVCYKMLNLTDLSISCSNKCFSGKDNRNKDARFVRLNKR
jgi:hypothetical protein